MDAFKGRGQTTKGIWLGKSSRISAPPTLVMDLEGSDGRERGEDDTSFERQSSLFALAIADVLVINIWAKDIGRESGAGKPLLKTVFQVHCHHPLSGWVHPCSFTCCSMTTFMAMNVLKCTHDILCLIPCRCMARNVHCIVMSDLDLQVNLKLFSPAPNRRRTVLLFVFRDRTRTPLPKLVEVWTNDLERMWESIAKPPQFAESLLTDFFEVGSNCCAGAIACCHSKCWLCQLAISDCTGKYWNTPGVKRSLLSDVSRCHRYNMQPSPILRKRRRISEPRASCSSEGSSLMVRSGTCVQPWHEQSSSIPDP